ncbi:MAG: chromosome segregation protein SMC [Betaproteobacteria bacterium RBG_16_56_24]|nr:MAG: chromosome segregation protein SMC [Betaproteobacteria bacterium RBG_16_56_24]
MRLSQIKLSGFKSFVDPTHISLPGQIVGVVGPNGCGKSNVIDALRWVLGESKASALRGETMQDVIFNGSSQRKPVSRASVELIFDNSLGKAAGQWSSYAEISIKRVLQRDGDSSYHINNQHVRRKDITDIFLGTGLGPRAYAIIEQGMISRIIEAKPEELRVFLEEAAGVSKYRDRRRETELRLGDTRDNLVRVNDILQELEKQLVHLGEQAEVAKQYRALETQRDTTQRLFWLVKKQEAEAQRARYSNAGEKTRNELEAETARLRDTESQLETVRSEHYRLSDALHAKQGELYTANAEIARLEQQIKHVAEQRQRLTQQIANTGRQIEQQQHQRQGVHSLLEHWQRQQEGAVVKLAEAEQRAQLEGQNLPQAEEAARIAQESHNALQREQLKLEQQMQLAETQRANLQRNIQQLESRRSRLLLEKDNLPGTDSGALHQAQQQFSELEMERAGQAHKLASLQEQLPDADIQRQNQRDSLQQQERLLAQTEARLHALRQLQGLIDNDKNLNAWLEQHQLEKLPRLWQSIRIENGWEDALEAVLRERLNAISMPVLGEASAWSDAPPAKLALLGAEASSSTVRAEPDATTSHPTRLSENASQVVGYVEAHSESAKSPSTSSGRTDGVEQLTPLLSYVECQDTQALPAMRDWLTHVYAVADLAQGYAQRAQLPAGGWFVTPQGHLVGAHSVLFHAPDSQLHGVLARQREIEKLEQELAEQNRNAEYSRQQAAQAEQHYQSIESQIAPLRTAGNELQQRLHGLQMNILKLNQAVERSVERTAQIEKEMQEMAEQLGVEQRQQHGIDEQMAMLREQSAAFHGQVDEAQRNANALDGALREQRERAQQAQHALQEAHFFSKTCTEKIADLQHNTRQITDALAQFEQNLTQLRADLSGSEDETARQQLQDALSVRQACEQSLAEARNILENATVNLQKLEQDRMACEHKLEPLREKLNELTLKEQEARLHHEQWSEQLQGVDEQALLPLLETGNNRPNALQGELNRLNEAIETLGAVNLAALEELQAASERKAYLDAQALDLNEAMATLEEAIRRIDKESRELLMDTYNQVNQHLSELFPILFAGGEARLVLTGEEILDSGVQVMAQPPGKKNSSIHLLSGGEKALTAIALVFSLFQLNPAPFCLLDEVDAPLDDTNTERLCALIRKMAQNTQFVFISHNKITMELAQQLVGVTMQEKGVSKVVAVDIEEALRMREEQLVA